MIATPASTALLEVDGNPTQLVSCRSNNPLQPSKLQMQVIPLLLRRCLKPDTAPNLMLLMGEVVLQRLQQ
jgi:hypothetical protein